jgi:hypothetical protein
MKRSVLALSLLATLFGCATKVDIDVAREYPQALAAMNKEKAAAILQKVFQPSEEADGIYCCDVNVDPKGVQSLDVTTTGISLEAFTQGKLSSATPTVTPTGTGLLLVNEKKYFNKSWQMDDLTLVRVGARLTLNMVKRDGDFLPGASEADLPKGDESIRLGFGRSFGGAGMRGTLDKAYIDFALKQKDVEPVLVAISVLAPNAKIVRIEPRHGSAKAGE